MFLALLLACTGADLAPPVDSTPECGEGELYDGEACVPEACGMAPWGDVEGTVYVDAAAEDGGDGSRDAPLSDLAAAVAASAETDVIAIAAGTYVVNLTVEKRDLDLRGRCAELVVLDGSRGDDDIVATVKFNFELPRRTDLLRLQGLTVQGGYAGVWTGGGTIDLSQSVFRDGEGYNLFLEDTDGALVDIQVLDVRPYPDYPDSTGNSLEIWGASTIEARGLYMRGGIDRGIAVKFGADLLLEDSVLDAFNPEGEWAFGTALSVYSADASVRNVQITDATGSGILVQDGTLDIEGLQVVGHRGLDPNQIYPSLEASWGGVITGSDVHIEDSSGGIYAWNGGSITLSQVRLIDTGVDTFASGLFASEGRIEVEDVELEGSRGAAMASVLGGELIVRHGRIHGVVPSTTEVAGQAMETAAYGLVVVDDARAELSDVELSDINGVGVFAFFEDGGSPQVTLTDVLIQDVSVHPSGRNAAGLYAQQGAFSAERLTVRDIAGPGLVLQSRDDTAATTLSCTDCDISGVQQAGVIAVGKAPGTEVLLDGCSISDVSRDDASGLSIGMLVTENEVPPTVTVRDCEVSGTAHGALFVVGDGAIDVQDSTLHAGSGATYGGLQVHGNAVYATGGIGPWDGERGLLLDGNELVPGGGDTVLLHDASATLQDNEWEGTGGVLRQQHCDEVLPVEGADEAPSHDDCPETDQLVLDIDTQPTDTPPIEL